MTRMTRMTAAQYREQIGKTPPSKPGKYRNKRTITDDGKRHDSRKEARRWSQLCQMQQQGLITGLERQIRYKFHIGGVEIKFRSGRPVAYVADFRYIDGAGLVVVEDVKGMRTPVYKLKDALMWAVHGIRIREI